ncbi:bifunctional nitrate reductase/sulfite reductase flavoprotein subunit alpha [Gordonia alkaliphila]|uniref:Bifunctional nitrate reductase/sulfite reductase flavoprotein subunit alpha n=1 Tax=Gordonia alkaliphila TaxID=1053547 RepID=A0ABP8Z9Y7_9ACTN
MTITEERTVATVCGYCGVGCGLTLTVVDDAVTASTGTPHHPANRGRLCTKGATTVDLLRAPGRLTTAWSRATREDPLTPVDVDDEIVRVARRFTELRDVHGPDAVALYVSGQMSIEAQYLANKLAKGYLRTPLIESNSRLCMASAATGYKQSLGADGPPGSYDDLDHADLFLVIGANMADCHPILFLRMMDRVKAGAKLIVVDPRRTATAAKADLHLAVRPGTDLALLNGLLRLLVEAGAVDHDFIAAHTEGWPELLNLLDDYPVEKVAARTGLSVADLERAAAMIAEADDWTSLWTMGLNQSVRGTWHTNALCNLHLATGAICRTGSGPFSLTGQPNAMGGREMGYMGPGLPGQRSALDARDRADVEALWGLPVDTIPDAAGGGTVDLFEQLAAGVVKAVWIICTNPVVSVANRDTVIRALEQAEFVVVQDVYTDVETAAYADAVLPAALWTEAAGVMVNSERSLSLCTPAVPAPGQARPDWQLIAEVATAMGFGDAFAFDDAAAVFDELARFVNPRTGWDVRGAHHARLADGPVQWPVPPGGADRNPIRYLHPADDGTLRPVFPTPSGRARFLARPDLPREQAPDGEHPMLLTTGRLAHQWHTRTKTARVPKLEKLNPHPFVQLHPDDAAALGIGPGAPVDVASRRGAVRLPAQLTDAISPGLCFVPMHWSGELQAINAVTSDAVDADSLQPEFKLCAVSVTAAPVTAAPVVVSSETATSPTEDVAPPADRVLVVWSSTTGTAQTYAEHCAQTLRADGRPVVLACADRVGLDDLWGDVLFVVATTGDGDAPDDALALWDALGAATSEQVIDLRYAVLGFGDSSYADFCGFARKLDGRLAHLQAQRLTRRSSCEPDSHAPADTWLAAVRSAFGVSAERLAATPAPQAAAGYSRAAPLRARLVANDLLSAPGSAKQVRRFAFELPPDTLTYEPGDALGVWPRNSADTVAQWLAATGLDRVTRDGATLVEVDGAEVSLTQALTEHYDITRITVDLVRMINARHPDAALADLIEHPARLADWSWNRQAVDLLADYPITASVADWLAVLRRLAPRLYSISSSPAVDPGRVETTVSVVGFDGAHGRRAGVCSSFLASGVPGAAEYSIFVAPNRSFAPPTETAAPMLMIGPGTGVAPFRGFLHHRAATGASGDNWLLFGEQHRATDFYYRDELTGFLESDLLTRLDTAFSRDQAEKIYVQDVLLANAGHVWSWLQRGAYVYVCGDATRMARDVDVALRRIVAEQGRLAPAAVDAFVTALGAEKRYVRDVY